MQIAYDCVGLNSDLKIHMKHTPKSLQHILSKRSPLSFHEPSSNGKLYAPGLCECLVNGLEAEHHKSLLQAKLQLGRTMPHLGKPSLKTMLKLISSPSPDLMKNYFWGQATCLSRYVSIFSKSSLQGYMTSHLVGGLNPSEKY